MMVFSHEIINASLARKNDLKDKRFNKLITGDNLDIHFSEIISAYELIK